MPNQVTAKSKDAYLDVWRAIFRCEPSNEQIYDMESRWMAGCERIVLNTADKYDVAGWGVHFAVFCVIEFYDLQ